MELWKRNPLAAEQIKVIALERLLAESNHTTVEQKPDEVYSERV